MPANSHYFRICRSAFFQYFIIALRFPGLSTIYFCVVISYINVTF